MVGPPVRREPTALIGTVFDVVVVGGGITGAAIAHEAASRGLTVALVERSDFGAETSANSLKVIHGGVRALQSLDLVRSRAFIRERSAWLRIAPGLVAPLPVLVPVGTGLRCRGVMGAALRLHDALGWDRNRGLIPGREIPPSGTLAPGSCRRTYPELQALLPRGAAIWYDALALRCERLVLALVTTAARHGAVVANHVEASALLGKGGVVVGVRARDTVSAAEFEIRGRLTVNAAGPWWDHLAPAVPNTFALGLNVVLARRLSPVGLGLRSQSSAVDDPVGGGGRYLFLCPWRDHTLLGTRYRLADRPPGEELPQEVDIAALLAECNAAWPEAKLALEDVTFLHWGWLPVKRGRERGRPNALAERTTIIEHAGPLAGLVSVSGVKLTLARAVAERVVDGLDRRLARRGPRSRTAFLPLDGAQDIRDESEPLDPRQTVERAVGEEMAVTLNDVVFRRTGLGTTGCPPVDLLERLATAMGDLLGWGPERRRREIEAVVARCAPLSRRGE